MEYIEGIQIAILPGYEISSNQALYLT